MAGTGTRAAGCIPSTLCSPVPILLSLNGHYPLQRFSQQFLMLRLRHATTAQDDASEAVASAFVQSSPNAYAGDGTGKDVDDFVKEFKEARKTYHKRVMWGDRWGAGKVQWRDD